MSHSQSATPIGKDGVVRCYVHGVQASLKTSRTATNPDRQFYGCALDIKDPKRCKFFIWADDPIFHTSTPGSSQRLSQQTDEASGSLIQSPATPRKRGKHSFGPSELPPSQKRLKIIEEVFKGERSPSVPSSIPYNLTEPPHTIMSGSSQTTKQEYDDFGFDTMPSPVQTTVDFKARADLASHCSDRGTQLCMNDKYEEDDSSGDKMLLTPPSSSTEIGVYPRVISFRDTLSGKQHKGKEKESMSQGSYWQINQDDPERHFHTMSHGLNSRTTFSSPDSHCLTTESMNERDLSADRISTMLLGLHSIPDYVRELEEKSIIAEQMNIAKNKKIGELEQELEALKKQNRSLERKLERFLQLSKSTESDN